MIDFLKLIQGMGVGFSIAAPVGAIGFLCIQQTLIGGILLGVVSGLGAATADMIYGILVALGITASQAIILAYKTPLNIIGGLFLCYKRISQNMLRYINYIAGIVIFSFGLYALSTVMR